jgi:hypothetical protein
MAASLLVLYLSVRLELGLFAAVALKLLVIAGYVLFVALTFSSEMRSLKRSIVSLLGERGNAIID